MQHSNTYYLHNPLIHESRRLHQKSEWVRQFDCRHMRPLIICRGPIRKETMDVFDEMGIAHYGILLSEKDSIVYQNALAPELREFNSPHRIHRVPDYSGMDKEEREQRIEQIIGIANDNDYNAIFAGYGFMAEDETMVAAMEKAGLNFIGPCSRTVHDAGLKDEAKRTALAVDVSVTPGIDNLAALTLLAKHPDVPALKALVQQHELTVDTAIWENTAASLPDQADAVLNASYAKGIDLYTIDELGQHARQRVQEMFKEYPQNRIRLKAISGGGGKGQRILGQQNLDQVPSLILEVLNEVKTTGVGDNKNILLELNIETTRHLEIQAIGNGDWSLALGGRDCSLQMHEQKLLEISVTSEELQAAIQQASDAGRTEEVKTLEQELKTLVEMEAQSERFSQAVGLDSVSTFECIVDRNKHFFMEMNTRIQVEHRVTELCYALKFVNPQVPSDFFVVNSLVEAMVLLATHGPKLPKPERIFRHGSAIEARLNATNQALAPHAGGVIKSWSDAIEGEIRDDQGICVHNPDTDVFMKYTLAGAYDSNIALILTVGKKRWEAAQQMAEVLRATKLNGRDLSTNLEFHYGLLYWLMGQNVHTRPTTGFILPYLTAVGLLKQELDSMDLSYAFGQIKKTRLGQCPDDPEVKKAMRDVLDRKWALLSRPLEKMFENPHMLSGWLSAHANDYRSDPWAWKSNPIRVLKTTYHYLNMNEQEELPPAYKIWDHDLKILNDAIHFYDTLESKLSITDFSELEQALAQNDAPDGFSEEQWFAVQDAHLGYQAGTEVLLILPYLTEITGFYDLKTNPDLSINIPEKLKDPDLQTAMRKVLAPPPVAKSNEILAASGGMFYSREAPGMDTFVQKGSHFNEGDPLYIIEVMKMFNKIYAPFAGTIDEVLVEEDGVIIKKGQPIFKLTPDEEIVVESPEARKQRLQEKTDQFLEKVL